MDHNLNPKTHQRPPRRSSEAHHGFRTSSIMHCHSVILSNGMSAQDSTSDSPTLGQRRNTSLEASDVLYIETTSADLDAANPSLFLTDSMFEDTEDTRYSSLGPRRTPPFLKPRDIGKLPRALAPRSSEHFPDSPFVVVQKSNSGRNDSSCLDNFTFSPLHTEEWAFYDDCPQAEPHSLGSHRASPRARPTRSVLRPRPMRNAPIQWD